jgi:hypothetical protein
MSDVDLLAIYAAGARVEPEKSRALPRHCYGDPAQTVRFVSEKCAGCKYERIIVAGENIGIGLCQKKNDDGSKRLYGVRCQHFREIGTK